MVRDSDEQPVSLVARERPRQWLIFILTFGTEKTKGQNRKTTTPKRHRRETDSPLRGHALRGGEHDVCRLRLGSVAAGSKLLAQAFSAIAEEEISYPHLRARSRGELMHGILCETSTTLPCLNARICF